MKYCNNNIIGWGISEDKLHSKNPDGTYKMLTMDIDFGTKCSLRCPHCFKKQFNSFKEPNNPLTFDDIKNVILQAKELGLESVKFLGAGEPFENEQFLPLLRFLTEQNIHAGIFTKGYVLGCDDLVRKYNGIHGFSTAKEFVAELYRLKTSIMLGYNSFRKDIQLLYSGLDNHTDFGLFEYREQALKYLVDMGFNEYKEDVPTRLALIASPYKMINIDEIFEIYKWGHEHNMYVAICPSTNSGLGHKELHDVLEDNAFMQKSIDLYTKIYVWSINNNIISFEDFKNDGVGLYPGGHPCNQTAAGMYVTIDGTVMVCPGLDGEEVVVCNDVRKKPLKEIWLNSKNYELAKQEDRFNFGCVARERDVFDMNNFYSIVYKKVLDELKCKF